MAAGASSPTTTSSSAATILVGISSSFSDDDDGDCSSHDLLSWVVSVLARPHDTVVALHILGESPKKLLPRTRDYKRHRKSRAFALSAVGEFANICRTNQFHLEARVKYCSNVSKGLVEEAKAISAQFLILGCGSNIKKPKSRQSLEITKYCFKNAPKTCSVFSIAAGNHIWPKEMIHDLDDLSSFEVFSVSDEQGKLSKQQPTPKDSPRTVLYHYQESESDSPNSNDGDHSITSSFNDSITVLETSSSPSPSPSRLQKINYKSPLKRVSSFLRRPFHSITIRKRAENLDQLNKHQLQQQQLQPPLRCFSYDEISKATNNFHPDKEVGRGGYSEVYRGDLDNDDSHIGMRSKSSRNRSNNNTIAVKRIAKEDTTNPRKEKEFLIELGIIGHVSHPNTASLVGYCVENGLYLVFEFSPNGNLCEALHGDELCLEWAMRYRIVLGIARGLHYLHKCCKHRIIHRDIKASNVLLGPDYEPKITDFGLAKWLPSKSNQHAVAPTIEGTFGYLAPEYFMHGMVDEKTDVYALGVLLLEIVSGKRPVDTESNSNLLLWARPLMESEQINDLVDPRLGGAANYDSDQVNMVVLTASYCVQQSASLRPSMTEVLELLEKGHDSEMAKTRAQQHHRNRMPKMSSDEMNDYSMAFGYSIPIDFNLSDDDDW